VKAGPIAAVAMATLLLTACSGPEPVSGALTQFDGGRQVTVPVPWADLNSGVSGIEPATVWVGQRGDVGFDIDLQGLEAQGAGAAWTAAASMAAAVGTLYSGRDPAEVDVAFGVTGPIDGPSAAALLTVAVLAALQGDPLQSGVTMTGTITPDGSIGPVGGVGQKLQSAADAGYSTVLVPASSQTLTVRGTGEQLSAVDYGSGLGLDVRPVTTVTEAYEILTGKPFFPPPAAQYVLPAAVVAAGEDSAATLVGEAEAALAFMPADAPERPSVAADVTAARTALESGDPAGAYGTAVDAVNLASRALSVERYGALIATEGTSAAQQALLEEAQSTLARARDVIVEASDVTGLGLEQVVSTPSALGWSSYAAAVLEGLMTTLAVPVTDDVLLAAAAVMGDQRVSVDILQGDALEIIDAMPSIPLPSESRASTLLSGYTEFLVRAGQANEAYLRDVLGKSPDSASRLIAGRVTSLLPVIASLSELSGAFDPAAGDLPGEIAESSFAMSYFVTSTSALAAAQAFAMDGFGIGEEVSGSVDEEAVANSIAVSGEAVSALADYAAELSLDAGSSVWSNRWGTAAFDSLSDQGRAGSGAVIALNESWYDVMELQIMLVLARESAT
jgi:hypothetical protein